MPTIIQSLKLKLANYLTTVFCEFMTCPFRQAAPLSLWKKIKYSILNTLNHRPHFSMTEANLKAILDTTIDSIIVINEYGIIQSCNRSTEKIFGYPTKELIGQNIKILQPEPFQTEHDSYIAHYLKTGEKHVLGKRRELIGKNREGLIIPIDLMVTELFIKKERFFLGIIRDVTERVESILMTQKNFLIERELLAKNNFLNTMSHELKTPLHSIMGFSECMFNELDGPLNEAQKKSLKQIDNSCKHLLSLVKGLLELSKNQAEQKKISLEPCNLTEILENTIQSLIPLANKKNLVIKKSFSTLKSVVLADKKHLYQAFLNILDNAIKYTDQGQIHISLIVNLQEIQIIFQDTGVGIDPFTLPKIFIPFMKTPENSTVSKEHTGMGLSISKQIIELYGGTIEVSSKKGQGTAFTIYFPIKRQT